MIARNHFVSVPLIVQLRVAGVETVKKRHTINSIKVFLRLIVQFLGFLFEFLEPSFCITVHRVLGVFAHVKLGPDRLGGTNDPLLEAFEAHCGT